MLCSWLYIRDFLFSLVFRSLKSWDMHSINVGFANGAEIDLKIMEDFKESELVEFLRSYADLKGVGGNILTGELY